MCEVRVKNEIMKDMLRVALNYNFKKLLIVTNQRHSKFNRL